MWSMSGWFFTHGRSGVVIWQFFLRCYSSNQRPFPFSLGCNTLMWMFHTLPTTTTTLSRELCTLLIAHTTKWIPGEQLISCTTKLVPLMLPTTSIPLFLTTRLKQPLMPSRKNSQSSTCTIPLLSPRLCGESARDALP